MSIGGLLAVQDTNWTDPSEVDDLKDVYLYGATGSVGQLLDWSDSDIVAKYEYDAFGGLLHADGSHAAVNTFRYSTNWQDPDTGTPPVLSSQHGTSAPP